MSYSITGKTFGKVSSTNRLEYCLLDSGLPAECTHLGENRIIVTKLATGLIEITYRLCDHYSGHTGWQELESEIDAAILTQAGTPLPVEGDLVGYFINLLSEPITMTNAPSAVTELTNQASRRQVDLRNADNFVPQMICSVIPVASTGKFIIQYSINGGSVWSTFYDFGIGYTVNVLKVGTLTAIPALAKVSNCLLRVVSSGGNATADPVIRHCGLMIQPL